MGIFRRILRDYLRKKPVRQHASEIEAAIERLVEDVNPRIRFVPDYQNKLRNATWSTLKHIHRIVGEIAGPVECSRQQWAQDPLLRSLFTNSSEMRHIFSHSKPLRDFLERSPTGEANDCYVVLAATRQVKKVLGVELRGDVVQREVPQIRVSFTDHMIMAPAASEAELRAEMKGFALEFLAHQALAGIASARSRHQDLEQERALLRARLRMKQRQEKGLGCLCGHVECNDRDLSELCTQLAEKEKKLDETGSNPATLDYFVQQLIEVLESPEKYLKLQALTLHLDSMNISVGNKEGDAGNDISLTELWFASQPTRVMLVAKFPRGELLDRDEMVMDIEQALKML